MNYETTLIIIKPDSVSARKIGRIISEFEAADLRIAGARMIWLEREQAETFYAEHRGKEFYGPLTDFMTSNPVLVMAVGGEDAVLRARKLIGKTNPAESATGTIRKKFAKNTRYNAVHGSDSSESARRETEFFFPGGTGIYSWKDREYNI